MGWRLCAYQVPLRVSAPGGLALEEVVETLTVLKGFA